MHLLGSIAIDNGNGSVVGLTQPCDNFWAIGEVMGVPGLEPAVGELASLTTSHFGYPHSCFFPLNSLFIIKIETEGKDR